MKRIIKNSNENLSFTKILSFIQNLKSILKVNSTLELNSTMDLNSTASFKRMTPLKLSTTLPLNSILKLFFTIFIFNATINLTTAANNPKALGYIIELENETEITEYKFTKDEIIYACLTVDGAKKNKNRQYFSREQVNTSNVGNNLSSGIVFFYSDNPSGSQEYELNELGFRYSVNDINVRIALSINGTDNFTGGEIILNDAGFNESYKSRCTGFVGINRGTWIQRGVNSKITTPGTIFPRFSPNTQEEGNNDLSLSYYGCTWWSQSLSQTPSCSASRNFETRKTINSTDISKRSDYKLLKTITIFRGTTGSVSQYVNLSNRSYSVEINDITKVDGTIEVLNSLSTGTGFASLTTLPVVSQILGITSIVLNHQSNKLKAESTIDSVIYSFGNIQEKIPPNKDYRTDIEIYGESHAIITTFYKDHDKDGICIDAISGEVVTPLYKAVKVYVNIIIE